MELFLQVVKEYGTDDCGGLVYDENKTDGKKYYAYFFQPHFPYTIG